MRAGKENGLLLPSTNGNSGQVLISQGNGNVTWSTPLTIAGDLGDIQYNNGSGGLAFAANANIENGYLRLITGMPNNAGAGGVALGAKDLAGRITPAFVGPFGVDATVQAHLGRNRIAQLVPVVGATTPTAVGQTVTPTGTATARSLSNATFLGSLPRVGYVGSANTTGSIGGFRTNQQWWRSSIANAGGFFYSCTFAITNAAQQASGRAFVGLYSSTAGSTNVEPTTLTNAIGICRSTTSNNFQIYGANGTANSTLINLGSNFPANTVSTDIYRLTLFAPPAGSTVGYRVERVNSIDSTTGQPYMTSGTITDTTKMPANNVFLAAYGWSSTGTLSGTAGIDLINLYVETDT